jgi:hypothetical protein
MQCLFNFFGINGLYMFQALLTHAQEQNVNPGAAK